MTRRPPRHFLRLALAAAFVGVLHGDGLAQMCEPAQPCGDVDDSGGVTAGDALGVLREALELPGDLQCTCTSGDGCPEGGVARTGQDSCWDPLDTSNPINPVACAGSGQDGELQPGTVLAFVDNGDGTVTDVATGLQWEKLSDDGSVHDWNNIQYFWSGALGKVQALNAASFAGHDDWRLPTVRELVSLVRYGSYSPAIDPLFHTDCESGCDGVDCACTANDAYWSSTTFENQPSGAWTVTFTGGTVATATKTTYQSARAVRTVD